MNRFFLLFSFFILIGFAKAYAQADSKKKAQPVQQTSAQLMIASTGEDSLNGFGEDKARTVISGYGEINVQKDKNAKTTTANV